MQIHRNYMIASCCLQHIRNQFRGDGGARFVFLVLPRVGEVRDYGGDAPRGGSLAGVDHDEEFHEPVVDVAGRGGLEDEYWSQVSFFCCCASWNGDVPSSSLTLSPTVTLVS